LKLALDMKDLGLDRASFVIQSFLPNTTVSKEDMELKLSELGSLDQMVDYYDLVKKNGITSDLGKLSGEVEKGKPHEMTQNLVMAQYYENEGNSRAAFGVYEMIELYHSDHPEREDLLFNLVRTAYNIGEIFKTNDYGQIFLKDFPKSSHVPNVEEFMLISLFQNGKYERCIEVANKLLSTLTEGTKQHDTALYCLGGSLFYSAQLDLAREPLSKHVALYGKGGKHKESPNAKATQYWEASNETYLQQWEIAAPKLDKFLADYPKPEGNSYFPSAMYDRANCHTQLNQEEESIKCLDVIIKNHTDDPVIDRSYSLRGNNHQTLGDFNSLKLARRAKNDPVEEEVLNNLVIFLGDKNQPAANDEQKAQRDANYKAAVQYYDEFWKKFSGGNYNAIVAMTGIHPLMANGRGEEALANLKEVIMKLASVENAPDMDKAINSYTEEYLMIHNGDAEKLKQHYLDDFQVMGNNVYALSLVKMSLVDAYERLKKNAQRDRDQGATDRWTRAIDATLKELANLPLDKLNNFTLVSIGDNIRKGAETDVAFKQASRFYRQAIENAKSGKEVSFKNEAIFGLAIVVVETGEQDKLAEAFQDLTNLRDNENTDMPSKKQNPLLGLIQIQRAEQQSDLLWRMHITTKVIRMRLCAITSQS